MLNTKLSLGSASSVIRVSYYIFWNLLIPLEEVQLKGLVGIYYDIQRPLEKPEPMKLKDAVEIMSFALTLPFRYSSCLWCLKQGKKSSIINNSILGVSTRFFSNYIRVRTRLNYGSDMELHYNLQSLGVPTSKDFPVDTEGNLRQDVIDGWCQEEWSKCTKASETLATNPTAVKAKNKDTTTTVPNEEKRDDTRTNNDANNNLPTMNALQSMGRTPPVTIQPWPNDVLFGRGVGCQNHSGNIRFREIMMGYKEQYDNVPRSKRRIVMATLRQAMKASGTRFLRLNKDGFWEECNATEIDTKIGQFFRSLRKHKRESLKSGI
mmetsp:Transcript_17358/g.42463  ORF Transcript_17358/g.42463 Transcript_17358/m.42463 type:complete len:321 (+) Transcript_17358:136-1098(+)